MMGITYLKGLKGLGRWLCGVVRGEGDVQGAEKELSVLSVASFRGPRRWQAVGMGRSLVGVARR